MSAARTLGSNAALVGRVAGGFEPRDGQHGGEGAKHCVGVVQRLVQRRLGIGPAGVGVDHGRLQPGAQAGQRRAQIVGDGVAGVAQAADRALQSLEHVIEAARRAHRIRRRPREPWRARAGPRRGRRR